MRQRFLRAISAQWLAHLRGGLVVPRFVMATIVALASVGCGGSASSDSPGPDSQPAAGAHVCSPGATQSCLGPGACKGAQACASSGSAWGVCDCGAGHAAGGSTGGTGGSHAGGAVAHGGANGAIGGSSANGGVSNGGASLGGAGGSTAKGGAGAASGHGGMSGAATTGGASGVAGASAAGGASGANGGITGASGTSGSTAGSSGANGGANVGGASIGGAAGASATGGAGASVGGQSAGGQACSAGGGGAGNAPDVPCNPVVNAGCDGVCDLDSNSEFVCYPSAGPMALLCQTCDDTFPCGPGTTCFAGECFRYCCGDEDCGSSAWCDMSVLGLPEPGLCVVQPNQGLASQPDCEAPPYVFAASKGSCLPLPETGGAGGGCTGGAGGTTGTGGSSLAGGNGGSGAAGGIGAGGATAGAGGGSAGLGGLGGSAGSGGSAGLTPEEQALCTGMYATSGFSATTVVRGSWQYNPGVAPIDFPGPSYPCAAFHYDGPTRPSMNDPAWTDAPDPDIIGYVAKSALTQSGYVQGQFRYFRSLVYLPSGATPSSFIVSLSEIDDSSLLIIYNSSYPSGISPTDIGGIDVSVGACSGDSNFAPNLAAYVVPGEVNVVEVDQVDLQPGQTTLKSGTISVNGSVVAAVHCNGVH